MKTLILILGLVFSFNPLIAQKKDSISLKCGSEDGLITKDNLQFINYSEDYAKKKKALRKNGESLFVCRVAIETDNYTYESFNRDTTLLKYEILKKIDNASKTFENQANIRLVVTYINIRKNKEEDPYNNIFSLMKIFELTKNLWNSDSGLLKLKNSYDKIIFITKKAPNDVSGIASLNGVECVVNWNSINFLLCHELGHSFGSPHTHYCGWPGGSIDYCNRPEGGCYEQAIENINGTIMSYCNGFNKNPVFHPLSVAVFEQHANKYFKKQEPLVDNPKLPEIYNVNTTKLLVWPALINADKYIFQYSLDSTFKGNVSSDTIFNNTFNCKMITAGAVGYARIKALNTFGETKWSNTAKIVVANNLLLPPNIISPINKQANISENTKFEIKFTSEKNAMNYLVEFSDIFNDEFKYSFESKLIETTSFEINFKNAGRILMRVKSIGLNSESLWSESVVFFVNNSSRNLTAPKYFDRSITTIEYLKNPSTFTDDIEVLISDKSDFVNIIESKVIPAKENITQHYSFFPTKTEANKTYFVKVNEYNSEENYLREVPSGIISSTSMSFVMGSKVSDFNVKYFTNDIYPEIENEIENLVINENLALFQNSRGTVKINIETAKVSTYTRENTNGAIGNDTFYLNLSEDGKSASTYQVTANDEGIGRTLRKFDLVDGKLLENINIRNPDLISISFLDLKNFVYTGYSVSKNAFVLGNIEGKELVSKFTLSLNEYFILNRGVKSIFQNVWCQVQNRVNSKVEIMSFNFGNREVTTYPAPIENENFEIFLTTKGIPWIIYKNSGNVFRLQNQKWVTSRPKENRFIYPQNICEDLNGNLYIVDQKKIYKYDGLDWYYFTENPFNNDYMRKILIDKSQNFWIQFQNGVAFYNTCSSTIEPPTSIILSPQIIQYGNNSVVTVTGCDNVFLNSGKGYERYSDLKDGILRLDLLPFTSFNYSAKCERNGCLSKDINASIDVIPTINFKNTESIKICLGDSILTELKVMGKLSNQNNFIIQTTSNSGKKLELKPIIIETIETTGPINAIPSYRFLINTEKMDAGQYKLKIINSKTGIMSNDSIIVIVNDLPAIKASLKGNAVLYSQLEFAGEGAISYSWEGPNNFKSNEQNPIIKAVLPTGEGTYKLTGKDKNNCSNSAFVEVKAQNPLGKQNPFGSSISVYPNPVIGKLNIKTELDELLELNIISLKGQLLLSSNFKKNTSINTGIFSNGEYIVLIRNKSQTYYQKIFVIK